MQSRSSLRRFGLGVRVGLVALACLPLVACSNGTADITGVAGTPGAAGTGAAGTPAGPGAAGATGVAGSGGGAAGTQGTAGSTASGVAGSGAAGSGAAGAAAGGSTGAGGAAAGGATGAAGSGLAHVMPSDGCGMPAGQALATYVKYTEMVTGVSAKASPRNYYVWLPTGYDPMRAYPTVFVGPGCGSNGMQGIQIQTASGNNAIVVGLDPSTNVDPEGRQCFDSQSFPDPEVPYFDQTLKAVESKYCMDKSRLFIEGFSSGSWMANLIGCVDAGTIRAQGNASGCLQGIPKGTCTTPIAYLEAHNNPDPNNSYQCGTQNRDEKVARNGCTNQTTPFDPGPMGSTTPAGATISCVQYMGCMQPTIFCTTTGLNPQHNPQDSSSTNLLTNVVWKLWMSLP
jgi:polyhydroxybutyrate depolymerase